jgi:hypothetical protein
VRLVHSQPVLKPKLIQMFRSRKQIAKDVADFVVDDYVEDFVDADLDGFEDYDSDDLVEVEEAPKPATKKRKVEKKPAAKRETNPAAKKESKTATANELMVLIPHLRLN